MCLLYRTGCLLLRISVNDILVDPPHRTGNHGETQLRTITGCIDFGMIDIGKLRRSFVVLGVAAALTLWFVKSTDAQQFRKYPKVRVSAETRIDWMFPLLRRSPVEPPAGMLGGYVSTRQRYVLFAPKPQSVRDRAMPLVLFISYRSTSIGWGAFGPTCARRGVIFAEPLKAGNSTPMPVRVRIVLDVLDDLRRRYTIDPDRTYIAGYSGGGATATLIASALPEYFGGVVASNITVPIPRTRWRLEQFRRRLSIVMFAGEREKAALNVGKFDGPIFAEFGVRSQYRVFRDLGHRMPSAAAFDDAFVWIEQGLRQRRAAAANLPSTRITGAPTREQQAMLFFDDAKALLDDKSSVHIGLAYLDSIAKRWPDLPQGKAASQIFDDYKTRSTRPWEEVAKRERLEQTRFLADLYDREATGIGLSKLQRGVVAQGAIDNWRIILSDSQDETLLAKARSRIEPLEKLVANIPGMEKNGVDNRSGHRQGSEVLD